MTIWHRIDDPDNPPPRDTGVIVYLPQKRPRKWTGDQVTWGVLIDGLYWVGGDLRKFDTDPTHWSPLPQPPEDAE